jgi:hypothetical protein
MRFTAGVQRSPVERCIVSSEEIDACYQLPQGRSQLSDGGRVADIVPRYAVAMREDELPIGWPDKMVLPPDDAVPIHGHESNGASAVRTKFAVSKSMAAKVDMTGRKRRIRP